MYLPYFLSRTNCRNLNTQIDFKVQRQLQECAEDLQDRRVQLAQQLHNETQQLNVELMELQEARLAAMQNERIEWIQMALMNSEQAEQDLLKQKQLQREIESSEAHRHLETRQILLDSKQAQLYQIEERREQRRRAAYVEKQWQL